MKNNKINLDFTKIITKNTWLTITTKNKDIDTKILNILNENEIIIKTIDCQQLENNINIELFCQKGANLYKIKGKIIKIINSNIYLLQGLEAIKIQERQFYRLNIYQTTIFSILNNEFLKDKEFHGNIEDISAEGIKLITAKRLFPDYELKINLDFANLSFKYIIGRVIKVNKLSKINMSSFYEAKIKFICDQQKEKKLAKYIFKKQMELKNQGLL